MISIIAQIGHFHLFMWDVIRFRRRQMPEWRLVLDQVYRIGNLSLPLVLITSLSIGMVMALQFGLSLERFGGTLYLPRVITLSILKEMGPVFTGLILAARVGAGMASEIGSMVVTQQFDAFRALGSSPIKKVLLPRIIACLICLPILVGIANFVACFGGFLVGTSEMRLDPEFYVLKAISNLKPMDYLSWIGKSIAFSFFISLPACYFGTYVENGTSGVGTATRKAVVFSSISILIGDFFITKVFWLIEKFL
jgi:phospholipid/cholesterol/gamma-HCH transport system permease protein